MNAAGLALLKKYEGCRLTAYFDVNGFACGYGCHDPTIEANTEWTQEMADKMLALDIGEIEKELDHMLKVPVSENAYAALVDFAFNLGLGALHGSTLLRYLNEGETRLASLEFTKWVLVDGKESPGLIQRREAEKALFLTLDSVDGAQAVA